MLSIFIIAVTIGVWIPLYRRFLGGVNNHVESNQKLACHQDKKLFRVGKFLIVIVTGVLLYNFVAGGVIMMVAAGWSVLAWVGILKAPVT